MNAVQTTGNALYVAFLNESNGVSTVMAWSKSPILTSLNSEDVNVVEVFDHQLTQTENPWNTGCPIEEANWQQLKEAVSRPEMEIRYDALHRMHVVWQGLTLGYAMVDSATGGIRRVVPLNGWQRHRDEVCGRNYECTTAQWSTWVDHEINGKVVTSWIFFLVESGPLGHRMVLDLENLEGVYSGQDVALFQAQLDHNN